MENNIKKCRLYNYDKGIEYILLNQSQIDLMNYLIENEHFVYDFEVLNDENFVKIKENEKEN